MWGSCSPSSRPQVPPRAPSWRGTRATGCLDEWPSCLQRTLLLSGACSKPTDVPLTLACLHPTFSPRDAIVNLLISHPSENTGMRDYIHWQLPEIHSTSLQSTFYPRQLWTSALYGVQPLKTSIVTPSTECHCEQSAFSDTNFTCWRHRLESQRVMFIGTLWSRCQVSTLFLYRSLCTFCC